MSSTEISVDGGLDGQVVWRPDPTVQAQLDMLQMADTGRYENVKQLVSDLLGKAANFAAVVTLRTCTENDRTPEEIFTEILKRR